MDGIQHILTEIKMKQKISKSVETKGGIWSSEVWAVLQVGLVSDLDSKLSSDKVHSYLQKGS